MNIISRKTALKLAKSEFWKTMTAKEIVMFHYNTSRVCMPFNVLHKAVEEALGRQVWSHEFGSKGELLKELMKEKPAPTLKEIINLIPKEKRMIIFIDKKGGNCVVDSKDLE